MKKVLLLNLLLVSGLSFAIDMPKGYWKSPTATEGLVKLASNCDAYGADELSALAEFYIWAGAKLSPMGTELPEDIAKNLSTCEGDACSQLHRMLNRMRLEELAVQKRAARLGAMFLEDPMDYPS
jgi:hypothetical protein